MKHSLLPGRQSIYSMKTLALLCFLLVLVCSETENEEPVPHLTDFHLFLDVSFIWKYDQLGFTSWKLRYG